MERPVIEVVDLVREYAQNGRDARRALGGIDLSVARGSVHGLLGPNGAGKTTLCRILSTVLIPTSGSARIDGLDVVADAREVRKHIGIVFGGDRGLYNRLTARQNLRYWSALYKQRTRTGAERADALLERFGLAHRANDRVETFSRGMKQRLHLARGLIADPAIVILDEPTTGMDPVAAHEFRALVGELTTEGRTVLLTTHDMAEAEAVCDTVTLIDNGTIVASATPAELGRWLSAYESVEASDVPVNVADQIRLLPGVAEARHEQGELRVATDADGAAAAVFKLLAAHDITSARITRPSLEDVYLHLIGGRGMKTS